MAEPDQNDDIERTLREIRAAYAARLPQRLREIGDALQQCLQPTDDPDRCRKLLEKLHGLSGSAGSFGFDELGMRATELEILLNDFLANGGADFTPIADGVRLMLQSATDDSA
jgi:chemotaxis protein histidine kinase CheA